MNNDKALLELAAKAAGIELFSWSEIKEGYKTRNPMEYWNPLTDDGDALRLAVKLEIDVNFNDVKKRVWAEPQYINEPSYPVHEGYGDDPYATTRRAIVRAAAEIGRGME